MGVPKVRLSLCPNKGKGRGKVNHVILAPCTMAHIKAKCCNKFKAKDSGVRLFIASTNAQFEEGTEITEENVELLSNGTQIKVATKGEDFIFSNGRTSGKTLQTQLHNAKSLQVPQPPLGLTNEPQADISIAIDQTPPIEETKNRPTTPQLPPKALCDIKIENQFPILEGNVLSCVRKAIEKSSVFYEKKGDGYIAFDYKSAFHMPSDTFSNPNDTKNRMEQIIRSIRRECRGLLLCASSGQVIARRFHKFFNLNEKEETRIGRKSIARDTLFLEKLDGSLVSPLILPSIHPNEIVWMTKTTIIKNVSQFISGQQEEKYNDFAHFWLQSCHTPLFEWCDSTKVVGQISHNESKLVLIAIRNNVSGMYVNRKLLLETSKRFTIPLVACYSLNELQLPQNPCFDDVHELLAVDENREGFVGWCETSGFMIKLKTLWYVSMASACMSAGQKDKFLLTEILKKRPTLSGVPPQVIWQTCLSPQADDIISMCSTLLESNDGGVEAKYLQLFQTQIQEAFHGLVGRWSNWANEVLNINTEGRMTTALSEKEIQNAALASATESGWPPKVAHVFLKGNLEQGNIEISNFIKGIVAKQKFNSLTKILNLPPWNLCHYMKYGQAPIHVLTIGKFQKASNNLREFVVDKYFPRKICNYIGISQNEFDDNLEIQIPSDYKGEEGKMKGMWERFVKEGILDLRVDIQPPLSKGFTDHFGDRNYCHWQVQYGASKVSKKSSKAKPGCTSTGAFAGILIQTDRPFPIHFLLTALKLSFDTHTCVVVGDKPQNKEKEESQEKEDIITSTPHTTPPVARERCEWQIYCDLDGVLADFESGFLDLTGKKTHEVSIDYMWKRIVSSGKFFQQLKPYSDSHSFWKTLQSTGNGNPIILTGLPNGKFAKKVRKQKNEWCCENLGPSTTVITCMSQDKHEYSAAGCILIDDRLSHKAKWEEKGGIFIHHTQEVTKTCWKLEHIISNGQWTQEMQVSIQQIIDNIQARKDKETEQESTLLLPSDSIFYVHQHNEIDHLIKCLANTSIVGIDCEWRPDCMNKKMQKRSGKKKSQVCLIQLSFPSGETFVIDMIEPTLSIRNCMDAMFMNTSIIKVGFGLTEDIERLNVNGMVYSLLDIQECVVMLFPSLFVPSSTPPLSKVVSTLLGWDMKKSKFVQASDWESRPLSDSQLHYAAMDAFLMLALYNELTKHQGEMVTFLRHMQGAVLCKKTKEYALTSLTSVTNTETQENTNSSRAIPSLEEGRRGKARVLFTSIVLSENSRKKIEENIPLRYDQFYYHHVTLAYPPSAEQIQTIPIGSLCHFSVNPSEIIYDQHIQCILLSNISMSGAPSSPPLSFFLQPNRIPHLTLSGRANIPPSRSNDLVRSQANNALPCTPPLPSSSLLSLCGTLAAHVVFERSMVDDMEGMGVGRGAAEKVAEFIEDSRSLGGSHLRFKPNELSPSERFALHEYCEKYGMESRSEGMGEKRRLILTKLHNRILPSHNPLPTSRNHSNLPVYIITKYEEYKKHVVEERCEKGANTKNIPFFTPYSLSLPLIPIPLAQKESWDILDKINKGTIDEECRIVIILRGLPGSGKSSFSTLLRSLLEPNENIKCRIVSADEYFYRGAGRMSKKEQQRLGTPLEVYQECFRIERLSEAHNYCKESFCEAIACGSGVIVIDNCNTKRNHFQFYTAKALHHQYSVAVVEMMCEDNEKVARFQERCTHGVSSRKMGELFRAWETCPEAVLLDSTQYDSLKNVEESTLQVCMSLSQWLSGNHFIHYAKKGRNASHLVMATDRRTSYFLDIPHSAIEAFHRHYIADIHSGLYIMELCSPTIRMFLDIDFECCERSPLSQEFIGHLSGCLQKSVQKFCNALPPTLKGASNENECGECIVTGFVPLNRNEKSGFFKCGLHLNFPDLELPLSVAKECRDFCVKDLVALCASGGLMGPATSWEQTVDSALYSPMRGLRMFGSRKVDNKGMDKGRLYSLFLVLDAAGNKNLSKFSLLNNDTCLLLKHTTIRSNKV